MKDFYVDQTTGDIYIDRFVEGEDFTAQSLWIRLSLWLGDWFLDNTKGTNWELGLSEVPPRLGELIADIRRIALGTWGITQILSLSTTPVGRKCEISLVCDTIHGVTVGFNEVFGE